jgi:acrylyl-CoA reductase (NADPH)
VPNARSSFKAFRIADTDGRIAGTIVDTTLDELSPGDVVIAASYSSVNYKDALAATGAAKILKRMPLVGGIDVAGTVASSTDARFREGDQVLVTGYDLGVANDGGYAAYVRVPADWVVKIPAGLTARDAMTLGTAGFTAARSVIRLEHNGLTPGSGPVIVTGATGGVGSIAVAILAGLGYQVTAMTGKDAEHAYLKSLGATEILPRSAAQKSQRPLEKATWAGAVDPVGGETLAWLTRTMNYGASIANSGLTGGTELHTTVVPFILRGINLLGIDSVTCPMAPRLEIWRRLATDMKPAMLASIAREIDLAGLPDAFATLAAGNARGRFIVNLS